MIITPDLGEVPKLTGNKLRAIVRDELSGDLVTRKLGFQLLDDSCGFGISKAVKLPKVGLVVDCGKVVFKMAQEQITAVFLPSSFRDFIAHEGFLALCLLELLASFT